MSTGTTSPAIAPAGEALFRVSLKQYHDMIRTGMLTEDDPVELLDGMLVYRMPKSPLHEAVIAVLAELLREVLPEGWCCRAQGSVTLEESEPEPDLIVAKGRNRDYFQTHPRAEDVALVVEVADTSLTRDRGLKKSVYARAGIRQYWVIDLVARRVEVLTRPDTTSGEYSECEVVDISGRAALTVEEGRSVSVAVKDFFP